MKIRITRTVKLHQDILKRTIGELLPISGPMIFIEEKNPIMFETDGYDWDDFFNACEKYRISNNFEDNEFLIVLTELKNDINWFSGFELSGERNIFIHASDWENYIYSEPEFPIAYEVIANILQSISYKNVGKVDFNNYIHGDPIGCVNDMCGWKIDITFKLRTGDICPDCLSLFSRFVEKDVITQTIDIFESLRKKMLHNAAWQKPMSFEENLPFSIAITKRKLGTTLEPFRKMLMLIDHFDSILRTSVLIIAGLTKSKEEMKKFLIERKLNLHPSLGHWVDALAFLAKENAQKFPELQLPRDFGNKVKEVIRLANEHKITQIRNEKRGHGYIECHDSSYKNHFIECLAPIDEIEKLLSPLFYRFKYYHIISLSRKEGKQFSVVAHDISGSNVAFFEKEIITEFENIEDLPIEDRFYLVTPDLKKWIDLNPYFVYGNCNVCDHNRVLIYDGVYMLDPYIGHRFQLNQK
jgi:hypothetical protein